MPKYIPEFMKDSLEHMNTVKELVALCTNDAELGQAVREYMKLVEISRESKKTELDV